MDNQTDAPVAAPQPLLCIVNRRNGYPADNPQFRFYEVCELPDGDTTREAIRRGHLFEAKIEDSRFTPELAQRVVAFRARQAELLKNAVAVQTSAPLSADDEKVKAAEAEAAAKKADEGRQSAVLAILSGKPPLAPPVVVPAIDTAAATTAGTGAAPASTEESTSAAGGDAPPAADDPSSSSGAPLRKR